nr:uncharacterized protein LOC110370210 [Helicoverpa armigera]
MEWFTTKDGKYRIESLSAATLPGALKLMDEHFFKDEPVCIGTEMNINPLAREDMLELCADAALDGMSLVAISNENEEVVSALFNKLQEVPTNTSEKTFFETFSEERCKHGPSRAVVNVMVELDAKCNFYEKYNADCACEFMFLGTHREHRRKNLGMLLCRTAVEQIRKLKYAPATPLTIQDLGPKYSFMKPRTPITKVPEICHALCTTVATQKIFKSLGFDEVATFPLADFTFNGKPYSKRGVSGFCIAFAMRINYSGEESDFRPQEIKNEFLKNTSYNNSSMTALSKL